MTRKSSSMFSNHELLEACAQPGCPVCCVGAHSVRSYLKSIFYEYVNDVNTRERLNKRLGFCEEHVVFLLGSRIADTLGASIIYENIVKVILRELPAASAKSKEATRKVGGLPGTVQRKGTCVACERRDTITSHALNEMSRALGNEKLRTALQNSDGLCLPHLSQLLALVEKPDDVNFLLEDTRKKLETRQSEMMELIRKSDYQSGPEKITHEEALAWKKAMCMIAGVSVNPTGDKHG